MVERATAMMSGLSSLTRKFSTGSGHRGTARPKSLSVNSGGLSKSTSEPMNLLTDQSPGEYVRIYVLIGRSQLTR